jgi:hypothetical protein
MADSYLYNPSETIGRGFAQVQASIGNVFTQLVAQKQNDYNIAEKTFENINALTDQLGQFGQEEITSKTQNLLNDAAKSIIKNGKLDYSEVGRIRSQVGAIKNRKAAIEAGTQMLKDNTQIAIATKDDLLNLATTLNDMRGVVLNPNNLSAEDMGRQMQSIYQKNINTTKAASDIFSRILPASEYATTYMKDGAEYQVAGTKITGFERNNATGEWQMPAPIQIKDANGKPVLNPDGTPKTQTVTQTATEAFKQQGEPILKAIRAQMGENSVFQTDEQLLAPFLQQYIQSKNTAQKELQVKSKVETDIQKATLEGKIIENKFAPRERQAGIQKTLADTRYINEKILGEQLSNKLSQNLVDDTVPLAELGIRYDANTKDIDLGKDLKINANWNGKQTPFLATGMHYNKSKDMYYLTGYPNPRDFEGKFEAGEAPIQYIPIGKSGRLSGQSYTSLLSRIKSVTNDESRNLFASKLNRFRQLELASSGQGAPAAPAAPAKAPSAKSQFSSGQKVGSTIYLDRKYQKAEAQIKKDNKAQNVIYIN